MSRTRNIMASAYDRVTPKTIVGAIGAFLVLFMLLFVFAVTAMGFLSGAGAAVDGEPLATHEVSAVEHQIWQDMGQGNAAVRSFYGLFHWLTAMSVWLGVLAMRVGYAIPTAAYVLEWPIRVIPYLFILLIAAQVVRVIELVVGKDLRSVLTTEP